MPRDAGRESRRARGRSSGDHSRGASDAPDSDGHRSAACTGTHSARLLETCNDDGARLDTEGPLQAVTPTMAIDVRDALLESRRLS
jgi:hypothetical protein